MNTVETGKVKGAEGSLFNSAFIACGKITLDDVSGIEVVLNKKVKDGDLVILTVVSDDTTKAITQVFGVVSDGKISITRNNVGFLANDATLAFGYVDTDSTGVTFGASTNTTPGVVDTTAQVETITCTAGESTGAGDVTMTITSANMTNSPKAVVVPVLVSDDVSAVALALRTALLADADVIGAFDVSGAGADAVLTAKATGGSNDAVAQYLVVRPAKK